MKIKIVTPTPFGYNPTEFKEYNKKKRGQTIEEINIEARWKAYTKEEEKDMQSARRCLLFGLRSCKNNHCLNEQCPLHKRWEKK